MNETQKRIKAYKEALPGLKERVVAVALLLAMSMAMMTSATFAWITLSRAPEIQGVSTTVTANGNLEIALADPSGVAPGESKVGDSSAADGQSVVKANLTWGNLVNLSDSSYGLSEIVLRPALLGNTNDLLSQPLKGVDYGEDGRLELYYNEAYQFTNWFVPEGQDGYFEYSTTPKYGVRAISTIKYVYKNNNAIHYENAKNEVAAAIDGVQSAYVAITENKQYINTLVGLMGDFMTDKMNSKDSNFSKYTKDMYYMLKDIYELMTVTVETDSGERLCVEDTLRLLANYQIMVAKGYANYVPFTYATSTELLTASKEDLTSRGVNLPSLATYKTLKNNIQKLLYGDGKYETADCVYDLYLQAHQKNTEDAEGNTVKEFDIDGNPVVDENHSTYGEVKQTVLMKSIEKMVDVYSALIIKDGVSHPVSYYLNDRDKAMALLGGSVDVVIMKGYLKDFEQLTGGRMLAENLKIKATLIITVSITASTITTGATEPYDMVGDFETVKAAADNLQGDRTGTAQDTYGMALDFWVRTNSPSSYLVLQGNVLTKTETVRDTGVDFNGNPVDLYTVTITNTTTDSEGKEQTVSADAPVYKVTTDGVEKWYYAENHSLLYPEDENGNEEPLPDGQTISTPIERYKEVSSVVGYEGENRIWEDHQFMDITSTTQGNGSCYIFYAEDPAQQENSLRLLKNLRVAFIDGNESSATRGKLVAIGKLDIENRYEESGKVTIPLVLDDDKSTHLTKTETGDLAIMPLDQNVSTRLTAVVYLDGREISNADVLAANDIHGQLNIQFGSTDKLNPIKNEDLELATRTVSAVAKKSTANDYPSDNKNPITYYYDEETGEMKVNVRVTVNGDKPTNVTAFFMRKVNATQGSREDTFELKPTGEENVFEGSFTFTKPGNYVLQTVQLDGVDYDLFVPTGDANTTVKAEDYYPKVNIDGFTISNVTVSYNGSPLTSATTEILTGDRSVKMDLSLEYASNQKLPSSVRLQFKRAEDNTLHTSTLTYNATSKKWNGSMTFSTSGEYILEKAIMDGEYFDLNLLYQKTLDITMGMTVWVMDDDPTLQNTIFEDSTTSISPLMFVEIYDDNDEEVKYRTGVKLHYTSGGSLVAGMSPDMTWNASEDCYVGHLQIPGPGVYTFNSVVVGGNTLQNTINTPPTFTCVSPYPVAYYDAGTGTASFDAQDYMLAVGGEQLVGLRLSDAAGATITQAIFERTTSTGTVTYTHNLNVSQHGQAKRLSVTNPDGTTRIASVSDFQFEMPKDASGYLAGEWKLTGLKMYGVIGTKTDATGILIPHTAEDPYFLDLTQIEAAKDDDLGVKVVNVKVTVTGEDENFTGNFMDSKTTKPFTVTVTDQDNKPLQLALSNLELTYLIEQNSWTELGGYTAAHLTDISGTGEEFKYSIAVGNDGITYTVSPMTLLYAGRYYADSMKFTVGGVEFSYARETLSNTLKMPAFTLSTTKPTVTIQAYLPRGQHNSPVGTNNSTASSKQVTSNVDATGKILTIYWKGTAKPGGLFQGFQPVFTLEQEPYVTLRLNGYVSGMRAELSFTTESNNGTVHLYSGESSKKGTRTEKYVWDSTTGQDSSRFVGYMDSGNCSSATAAGTLNSGDKLYLYYTVNGAEETFEVTISQSDRITIIHNKAT